MCAIVLLVTFVLTVVFDLTYGVLGGVAVTFIANAKNLFKGLTIEKDESAQTPTLVVTGTLYFVNANKLADAVEKEFESADNVTVDMRLIERIDETALEKIVSLNKKIKAKGKNLDLIGYNEKICKRFDKFFKILASGH